MSDCKWARKDDNRGTHRNARAEISSQRDSGWGFLLSAKGVCYDPHVCGALPKAVIGSQSFLPYAALLAQTSPAHDLLVLRKKHRPISGLSGPRAQAPESLDLPKAHSWRGKKNSTSATPRRNASPLSQFVAKAFSKNLRRERPIRNRCVQHAPCACMADNHHHLPECSEKIRCALCNYKRILLFEVASQGFQALLLTCALGRVAFANSPLLWPLGILRNNRDVLALV